MSRHGRHTGVLVTLLAMLMLVAASCTMQAVRRTHEPETMAPMRMEMNAVGVGRFLIDVPVNVGKLERLFKKLKQPGPGIAPTHVEVCLDRPAPAGAGARA